MQRKRHRMAVEGVAGIAVRQIRAGLWQVDAMRDGKRYRKAFAQQSQARAHARRLATDLRREGSSLLDLSPERRMDALNAFKLLDGTGGTLVAAANAFLRLNPKKGGETFAATADEYLAAMKSANRRAASIRDKDWKLSRLKGAFGERATGSLIESELLRWSEKTFETPGTARAYFGAGRDILRFHARGNRLKERHGADEHPPVTWPVQTCAAIMRSVEQIAPDCAAPFAILLFAGLRPTELLRLRREDIDLESGVIRLEGSVTKTRTIRNVNIAPNLREWLQRYPGISGPLVPQKGRFRLVQVKAARMAGLSGWTKDAPRHTFATAHYNACESADSTMKQLGHFGRPDTFVRHYKGVPMSKADALAYWQIVPTGSAKPETASRVA